MSEDEHPPGSVYKWLPKEVDELKKPPRYVSKYRPAVIQEHNLTKKKTAKKTMGPPKVEVPSPDMYLKKHSNQPKPPEKSEDNHKNCTCPLRKPPVPAQTDNPQTGIQTKRNFLQTNVMLPMKPKPTFVDTKKGHKQLLENSGLVPKYIMKRDFGEVPEYLRQRKEAEQRAQEEYERSVKEQVVMQQLSDKEKLAALEGLKKKWDELHHEYQSLPLILGTPSAKAHKIHLEEKMSQLEKDISLLEKFKTIYIADN